MAQTYYLSELIRQYGDTEAFARAKKLRDEGNTVWVDAESIFKRVEDPAETLKYLEGRGYKIKVNQQTIQDMYGAESVQKMENAMKRGWNVYSQPTPQQAQQQMAGVAKAGITASAAHVPEPERLQAFGQMMESPHQVPVYSGPTMRAATPQEAKEAILPPKPVLSERWVQGQNMLQPTESAPLRVEPERGIGGRAAQRVLDTAMAPMGAGMRAVLMPERYWESAKALSNVLSNSTGQVANALGLGKYEYTDWYNTRSKKIDDDIGKVLGPVDDITTVMWRQPIVALGLLGAATRTIADMSVTPFTSEKKGAEIAGANMAGAPLTAAIVDPVGSAFESVGSVAAQGYKMAGGSPETADKIRGLGTVAVLAAFHIGSAKRLGAIRDKVKKGEKLAPEEQAVVDTVAPMQNPEAVVKSLEQLELNAKTNADVLDKVKENQVVRAAVEPAQNIKLAPEVQSAVDMDSLKNWINSGFKQEVPNAEGLRENAGQVPQGRAVVEGGEVQGGADLQRQAQVPPGGSEGQVNTTKKPIGELSQPEYDVYASGGMGGTPQIRVAVDKKGTVVGGVGYLGYSNDPILGESLIGRKLKDIQKENRFIKHDYKISSDEARTWRPEGETISIQEPQSPPGVAPEQVKQPWEMTREEFDANWIRSGRKEINEEITAVSREVQRLGSLLDKDPKNPGNQQIRNKINELQKQIEEKKSLAASLKKPSDVMTPEQLRYHRGVEAAVKNGENVPPEVLAEYPDLAKSVTHQMPTGETMAGPEHPGAVPGSTGPAEVMPPQERMAVADPIGAAIQGAKKLMQPEPRPDLAEKPVSLFEDPEKYFEANKGIQIQEPGLWEKVKKPLIKIKQSFARSRPNLDPRASVPEAVAQETLRRFQDAPERAEVSAVNEIAKFTSGLAPNRKDSLYRVVMLEDLKKDLENEKIDIAEKPLGYESVEQVDADLQNYRAKMLSDPKTADAYGRRQKLFRPIVEALVEAGRLPEEALDDPRYYHHQVLEHYLEGARPLGTLDLRLHRKGFEMRRTGSAKNINTEGIEADFEWLSQAYFQLNTLEAQAKIKQAADKSLEVDVARQVIKEATGVDVGRQIPDGYVEWQVPPNHPFFRAQTVPERIVDQVTQYGEARIGPEDLKQVTAVGKGETWVIPENIAKELDNIAKRAPSNVAGEMARGINNAWKRWVILNPWRSTKYMLNNLTGDLDAVVSIAPGSLKNAKRNSVLLWKKMWQNKSTPEFDALYNEAMDKSILQSGMTLEEIPDVKKLPALKLLNATMDAKDPFWKRPDKMVGAAFEKYWTNINTLNIWRESVLRLSAYEYWKQKLAKGDRRYYGASDKGTINQMYEAVKEGKLELNDVAARLARDTLGDYGNVSQAGQWLRRTTHPFWSWVEINVPRYYNLFKNIAEEGRGKDLAGTAAYTGAKLAASASWKAAKVYAFSQAFFALVNVHNKTLYPEEDKLINKAKGELYLITPFKNEDGSRRVVRFSGALSDALSMFGLRDYIRDVPDLLAGKTKAKDAAWKVLTALPEQGWQRISPFIKAPAEIGMQRQTYPRLLTENWPEDVTKIRDWFTTGRPIRSGEQQLWKYASMDWVYNTYRKATGRPMPGRDAALADLISTSVDTNQAAYYQIREKTYDFLRQRGESEPGPSQYKDKANAAYFFKVASQIDDKDAAKYWFREYMKLAKEDYAKRVAYGNEKTDYITYAIDGLNKSIEATSPLGALPEKYRAQFIKSLDPQDREILNAAMAWYHKKLPHKAK